MELAFVKATEVKKLKSGSRDAIVRYTQAMQLERDITRRRWTRVFGEKPLLVPRRKRRNKKRKGKEKEERTVSIRDWRRTCQPGR